MCLHTVVLKIKRRRGGKNILRRRRGRKVGKMREKDPRESDQVKTLYSKLNAFVLELLTDSSLDMKGYDNSGMPTQLNNKTRTTGMFGENSNSLITNTDTDKVKESVRRQKVKPYNSIWSLYQ